MFYGLALTLDQAIWLKLVLELGRLTGGPSDGSMLAAIRPRVQYILDAEEVDRGRSSVSQNVDARPQDGEAETER